MVEVKVDAVTGIGKVRMDPVLYNTPIFQSHSHSTGGRPDDAAAAATDSGGGGSLGASGGHMTSSSIAATHAASSSCAETSGATNGGTSVLSNGNPRMAPKKQVCQQSDATLGPGYTRWPSGQPAKQLILLARTARAKLVFTQE